MSYKCKNCGQKFDTKPDYCDCGNNVFIEIQENQISQDEIPAPPKMEYEAPNAPVPPKLKPQIVDDEIVTDSDKLLKENLWNTIGLIVLIISLFLGITLIYRAFSMPVVKELPKVKKPVTIAENIPDIDLIWDNSTKNTDSVNTNSVNKNVKSDIPVVKIDKPQNVKLVDVKSKNDAVKTITKPQNKEKLPLKTDSSKAKPVQTTSSKSEIKQKTDNSAKRVVATQNTNSVIELVKYKNELRQALFNHFPILNVQGEGIAQVGFSVSSDGKLLNRHFVKESDNKSLNDAMYHMLMRTPSYNVPPSSYKGNEFVLQMEYNNGYYSFSYIK